MFTGLVEEVGTLTQRATRGPSARATILCRLGATEPLVLGESVAVNGACLTVARILDGGFEADVSSETLEKTALGALSLPARVNLERASKLGARMGGHVVLGHVDATARVVELVPSGEARRTTFELPGSLAPFVAPKGSIAIDGVSLTVNDVEDGQGYVRFAVMLVPHTLSATTLPGLRPGDRVNVEVDVLARYVQRQLGLAGHAGAPDADPRERDDARLLEKLRGGGWV